MDWLGLAHSILIVLYTFALVMVSLYGLHRYVLVYLYYRHRNKVPRLKRHFDELPRVTIQLPMYNEHLVARRIIEAASRINYPREKLDIQVLDDSTDQTVEIAREAVREIRATGVDISYIHRDNRMGYKAGALENGLETAKGEFITIFDVDFIPSPDILLRSIHYFTDPRVCVVQTRWEHLNRNDSLLTKSQALFLDGHFAIEHVARNRSQRFMSFNGTAGTWRRTAIDDAGGWQHDTLTEDLDLSFRAQIKGWKFIFLPDLTSPAELPPEMGAFKAQQFRWTKGGAQTALKLLPRLLLSKLPLKIKIEGFFHLTSFTMHLYMMILVVLLFPALCMRCVPMERGTLWRGMFDITVFSLATLSATVFYAASQFELFGDWRVALKYMPMIMAIGVGLCVSNAKAITEAVLGKRSEFVRTPKYGRGQVAAEMARAHRAGKKHKTKLLPYIEMVFGLYMAGCAIVAMVTLNGVLTAPFLIIFAFGFFYVSVLSLQAEGVGFVFRKQVKSEAKVAA